VWRELEISIESGWRREGISGVGQRLRYIMFVVIVNRCDA
jgi:hypothetical protein